jgi:hypothetical protein
LRTALFRVVTQRVVAIPSDVSGKAIGPIFKGQGIDTTCCVTALKIAIVIYFWAVS